MDVKRYFFVLLCVAACAVLLVGGFFWYFEHVYTAPPMSQQVPQGIVQTGAPTATSTAGILSRGTSDFIRVSNVRPNDIVHSPLTVQGEARGNWYFEASFPVKLYDADGKELAAIPAQAQGDWMTTEFVPFEVTLEFTQPSTDTGALVLKKDNPSGLPEHDDQLVIPVRFR